ncbi:hypothetical protein WR25_15862 [Diploscapter pachys]|uniref:Protein sleepless n=1 Tax=Diploscapter pachys TaxID=2018661 RepID=A0A2A2LM19_9BILA|nr:hypothetical protein WR25_15862 [Diploscapter pachys]
MRWLLSVVTLLCLHSVVRSQQAAFKCYQCNSIMHPECDENLNEKYLKICGVKSFGNQKGVAAIGCRVTRQHANGESSIIRECAYNGKDVDGRSNKGSMGVSRVFSQCSDKAGCNSVSSISYFVSISFVLLIFISRFF